MASDTLINQLRSLSDEIYNVDMDRLLRGNVFGRLSLKEEFTPRLDNIKRKLNIALESASELNDNQVQSFLDPIQNISSAMEEQANLSNEDYVLQRVPFLDKIDSQLKTINNCWPPFITAAVESRGSLMMRVFVVNSNVRSIP